MKQIYKKKIQIFVKLLCLQNKVTYICNIIKKTMRTLTLLAKGIEVKKECKNDFDVFKFYRDMPAKHGLLFSGKPYIIKESFSN